MKTQIAVTGHTLVSGEKLTPEMRQQVEQLVQTLQAGASSNVPLSATVGGQPAVAAVTRQFIVNGHRYTSLEEMPENERKLFQQVGSALLTQGLGGPQAVAIDSVAGQQSKNALPMQAAAPTFLNPGKEESDLGWLVQFFVLVLGVAIGLGIAGAIWFAVK
jgi:hypothetical protein